ncbi:MAG: DNA primase [Patescibacteria group bacterium]
MNEIEDIKSRIDIVELAKEYMTLRPAGRNMKAICPLHSEKTPSLMIAKDKQIWRCFGCGEGGDIFTMVQKMEGVDFYEALKILAEKVGVELKKDPGFIKYKQQEQVMADINAVAMEFYHQAFLRSKSGQVARDYIAGRGLDQPTVAKFKIGFAPNLWEALTSFLAKRKYSLDQIVKVGLGSYTKKRTVVDRFRGRVMFPIWNERGRVVGFTGRVLDEKDNPKYLNTAATSLFDKSRLWYAMNLAKNKIREKREAIICEGQMDVITCHQFGFDWAVCSSGTAVSNYQMRQIKRLADTILLAFDNDEAGRKSGYRLTEMALEEGLMVKVIDMGKYKDPDEFIRADLSGWQQSMTGALGFVEYFLQAFGHNLQNAKDKSQLADNIIPLIYRVKDEIGRGHYISELAERLSVDEQFVLQKYNSYQPRAAAGQQKEAGPVKKITYEERLVALLILLADMFGEVKFDLQDEILSDKMIKIMQVLKKNANQKFTWDWFRDLSGEDLSRWQQLVMTVEKDYDQVDKEMLLTEIGMLADRIKEANKDEQKGNLEQAIVEAESSGDREKVKDYIRRLQDLIINDK